MRIDFMRSAWRSSQTARLMTGSATPCGRITRLNADAWPGLSQGQVESDQQFDRHHTGRFCRPREKY